MKLAEDGVVDPLEGSSRTEGIPADPNEAPRVDLSLIPPLLAEEILFGLTFSGKAFG
jgi:hypothetical protein